MPRRLLVVAWLSQ